MFVFSFKLLFRILGYSNKNFKKFRFNITNMARGLQKLQSQAKNLEKQNKAKSAHDNKKSAQEGLKFQCVVCKVTLSRLLF